MTKKKYTALRSETPYQSLREDLQDFSWPVQRLVGAFAMACVANDIAIYIRRSIGGYVVRMYDGDTRYEEHLLRTDDVPTLLADWAGKLKIDGTYAILAAQTSPEAPGAAKQGKP